MTMMPDLYTRRANVNRVPQTGNETAVVMRSSHPPVYQIMGMDGRTGKMLSGMSHLRQSLQDILTTYVGTRVMRRRYGSELFALIDAAGNRQTIVQVYYAIAVALHRWEPRFKLTHVQADDLSLAGHATFTLFGEYLGQAVEVTGLSLGGRAA